MGEKSTLVDFFSIECGKHYLRINQCSKPIEYILKVFLQILVITSRKGKALQGGDFFIITLTITEPILNNFQGNGVLEK